MLSLDTPSLLHAMTSLYEIHCYQGEVFQYVVARTNKLSEEKVREDVKKMNHALGSEIHKRGIKYVFAVAANSRAVSDLRVQKKQMNDISDKP
jgi:hypothetical protein